MNIQLLKRKKEVILYGGVGMLMLSILFLAFWATPDPIAPSQVKLVLRDAGHHFLLSNHDSTSRVMPVIEREKGQYEVSFQTDISITPDSLARIFNTSIAKSGILPNYLLEVESCQTAEVVYSFQMSELLNQTIIPCLGRELPKSCYSILVNFSTEESFMSSKVPYGIGLLACVFALVFGLQRNRTPRERETISDDVNLGDYVLNFKDRILTYENTEIKITEKECELLAMFVKRPNQVIPREEMLHEIWESKGVFVSRSLDTYISKLRKKLSQDDRIQIINIHGIGYKLEC